MAALLLVVAVTAMNVSSTPAHAEVRICKKPKVESGLGGVQVASVCYLVSDASGGQKSIDWGAVLARDKVVETCKSAKTTSDSGIYAGCLPAAQASASPGAKGKDLAGAVQKAIATLQIPTTQINIGPDPSVNEWNMVAVGEPIWLWSAEATSLSNTVTTDGITVAVAAFRTSLEFSMGDGNTVSCVTATPRPPKMLELKPSPDCGHAYSEPNKAMPITAKAVWQITWSTGAYHGGLTFVMDASRTIDVGELTAVITTNP